jgi:hypothetical protein
MDCLTRRGGSPRSSASEESTAALFECCQDRANGRKQITVTAIFLVRDTVRSAKIVFGRLRSEIPATEGAAVWWFNG